MSVDVIAWSRQLPAGKMEEQPQLTEQLRLFRLGLYKQWDMTMSFTLTVLDWLQQQKPYDAVWGHYLFPAGFLATWFAGLNNIPSVISARGNDVDRGVFPPGDLARLLWTVQHATSVCAVSRDLAHKIHLIAGRKDVHLLANSVDSSMFAPQEQLAEDYSHLKKQLGIKEEEVVLGFTGELREKKGLTFLLHALTQVRTHRPACLLVIGDVRTYQRPAIQLYTAEFPEEAGRLIITGHIPDPRTVAQHLQICDLFLLPSLMDGMPNSLLEAMSCRRVCITSDAGGIPEVIDHGINGFMLPRAQLNHLDVAILDALELSSARTVEIGHNARSTVSEQFSLGKERAALSELMNNLLNTDSDSRAKACS